MFVFQDESVAPCVSFPAQEVSSEQGLNLGILFLCYLDLEKNPLFEPKPEERYMFDSSINDMNRYCYIEKWNQAICQATNISQERQKTSNICIEDLFSCLIEFIKISNKQSKLGWIINLLEEMKEEMMKTDPTKHLREIQIWDYVIDNSHKRLVFPYAEFSTEKEISVEQGFTIIILFFLSLYPLIEPHFSQDPKEQMILSLHEIVLHGYEYSAEWNEAVFRVTKMSKWQQKENNILLEALFSCVIEFARIFHKRFKYELNYLMNLLEAIQKDPDKFPIETTLWKQTIKESYSARNLYEGFNWNSELLDDEKY